MTCKYFIIFPSQVISTFFCKSQFLLDNFVRLNFHPVFSYAKTCYGFAVDFRFVASFAVDLRMQQIEVSGASG